MRNLFTPILPITAAAFFGLGMFGTTVTNVAVAAEKTEILVYTAAALDDLNRRRKNFEEATPDVTIRWLRPGSTGVTVARLLAEKDNPKADAIYGIGATHMMVLARAGILHPYRPKYYDTVTPKFRDPKNDPPMWVGEYAYIASICFNTVLTKKKGIPRPTSWKDLTKPVYKGHIIMPSPNASGTGFLNVSSWLQMFGWDEGWKFMDALDKNIAYYERSGSKPCVHAGQGEIPLGISFAFRGVREIRKGAPLEIIPPSEGLGWEMNASGIHKGTKKLVAAQKFMDWVSSEGASVMHNETYAIVSHPKVAKKVEHYPADPMNKIIKNDFYWASDNREKILNEWTKRYSSKTIAKKKKKKKK